MNDIDLDDLLSRIRACRLCEAHLPLGPRPVIRAEQGARVMIIGQAPGTRVHESGIPWHDRSGDQLRDWLAIEPEIFYDESRIAIVPMGFCYPGVNPNGGDNPPRPECADAWHDALLTQLPKVELILLVGMYAQARYLGKQRKKTLTATVAAWQEYAPRYLPLPHPSWRNLHWRRKNPWFETDVLPILRIRVQALL
jgi:uracil-DNA glycosylase